MNKHQFKLQNQLENKQHNMLIHGFLMAIQDYVTDFKLISTAAYVLKTSGIDKADFIRRQQESGYQNEMMFAVIEKAFATEEPKKSVINRNQVTTADKLVEGDRFYKLGDKKKTVMAVFEIKTASYKICLSQHFKTGFDSQLVKYPKEFEVVFLRHEIEIA